MGGKYFFDFDSENFCYSLTDNMAMDSDGNMLVRMSGNMAMDIDSGDLHIISSWNEDYGEND